MKGDAKALAAICGVIAVAGLVSGACALEPAAASQGQGVVVQVGLPAGMAVFADPVTGCEYLHLTHATVITPRYEVARGPNMTETTTVKGCR